MNPDDGVPCLKVALNPPEPSTSGLGLRESLGLGESSGLAAYANGPMGDQDSDVKVEMDDYDWVQL